MSEHGGNLNVHGSIHGNHKWNHYLKLVRKKVRVGSLLEIRLDFFWFPRHPSSEIFVKNLINFIHFPGS